MEHLATQPLRIWKPGDYAVAEAERLPVCAPSSEVLPPLSRADDLFLRESLRGVVGRRNRDLEPYSNAWLERVEYERHRRQGSWISGLLEFERHKGETVLGVGEGLGTDWLSYARAGANMVVCMPDAGELSLVKRNFSRAGVSGRFEHCAVHRLPIPDNAIDVVCYSRLPADDAEAAIAEVCRVLRPGGKVITILPARYTMGFWLRHCLPWTRLLLRTRDPYQEKRYYTRRTAAALFADFVECRVRKRHLRRGDMPHLFRWVPPEVLERSFGKLLFVRAFKPLIPAAEFRRAA